MKDPKVLIFREALGFDKVWIPDANKTFKLYLIEQEAGRCKRCPLWRTRDRCVFGWGNPYSGIMAIGEAPGPDEDRLGKPFVGRAGEFLDYALKQAGIDRERDLYLGNVLKCIPVRFVNSFNGSVSSNNVGKWQRKSFRAPQLEEVRACSGWLEAQIKVIKPRFILAMGNPAAQYFLGRGINVTQIAGQPKKIRNGEFILYPVMHPSFIVRQKTEELEKRYIEHLKRFRELVGDLIQG
ncbi:MAG TPA: uracil-DNA glycosylase [Candidatus Hydrothermia bacterium]|nr:uracil-DNA glycosylase [Candidatus Hydrothermae bacterium]MDD5572840.1 uracil-DNA glycosylase [Candidatus Hydrothermia bacterium]HOK22810.1 uracil-DNA glycosylase [Candidatus Hydrothermia bacterium]HOL23519.1 uracil-DNA glycosylase [Candidatus Hydrothermia bacterium]HOP32251.1 uracil-DNA glycosylase [Candidatus Hydrothermia bacterium]